AADAVESRFGLGLDVVDDARRKPPTRLQDPLRAHRASCQIFHSRLSKFHSLRPATTFWKSRPAGLLLRSAGERYRSSVKSRNAASSPSGALATASVPSSAMRPPTKQVVAYIESANASPASPHTMSVPFCPMNPAMYPQFPATRTSPPFIDTPSRAAASP